MIEPSCVVDSLPSSRVALTLKNSFCPAAKAYEDVNAAGDAGGVVASPSIGPADLYGPE